MLHGKSCAVGNPRTLKLDSLLVYLTVVQDPHGTVLPDCVDDAELKEKAALPHRLCLACSGCAATEPLAVTAAVQRMLLKGVNQ